MEFTLEREPLLLSIQNVQNVITQKSSLPILSNVLIEAETDKFSITATDLDIGICSTIPSVASEAGSITVPAKKFFDIIRSLPDGEIVNISIKKGNIVLIKSGRANFKIHGLPKEDFPELPLFKDKDSITMKQSILKEMFNLTDFAISKDDTRHVLTGVLFSVKGDTISVIATDGRRMAVVNKKLDKKTLVERNVIIPLKTVQEVKRLLADDGNVIIQFNETQVLFSMTGCFVISRLIEGEFPDYNKVIPSKSSKIIKVMKDDFLSAARRVSIFTEPDSQAIRMDIQKTKITISKNTPYLGEAREEVKIDYTGDSDMGIGFNPRYFIDVLKNLQEEEITFEINDPSKPGVIRKGDEYIYVVLPMQLV